MNSHGNLEFEIWHTCLGCLGCLGCLFCMCKFAFHENAEYYSLRAMYRMRNQMLCAALPLQLQCAVPNEKWQVISFVPLAEPPVANRLFYFAFHWKTVAIFEKHPRISYVRACPTALRSVCQSISCVVSFRYRGFQWKWLQITRNNLQ